jgi:hypothetical protein
LAACQRRRRHSVRCSSRGATASLGLTA